jgi:hypothetical protein
MIQFYLLSVVFNVCAGLALGADRLGRREPALESLAAFLRDPTVRLVLGILSLVVGALKFITTIRGDIPIVGDFVPAVAGVAVGLTLLLELGGSRPMESANAGGGAEDHGAARAPRLPAIVESFLVGNKTVVGFAGAAAGVIHFLFPTVLFL